MQDNEQMQAKGLRFGFIGVGQCGGNIANEFAPFGYKAIAINTSETDLKKLNNIQKLSKLLINTGIQGAGKDPEVGKEAFAQKANEIFQSISTVFSNTVDLIFICVGLGGGTGTGIAPSLAKILVKGGYIVNMIVTLPSDDESPKSKIVALSGFEELSQIEDLKNIFVIDNERNPFQDVLSIKNKYSVLNANIANKLDILNTYSTYASDIAFDARDLLSLLKNRGTAAIFRMEIEDVAELAKAEFLPQLLNDAFKDSCFANLNYKQARGCAILFGLPAGGSKDLHESSIRKMKAELGTPFESTIGVYEKTEKLNKGEGGREGFVYVMLTGLPYPEERLKKIQEEVAELEPTLTEMAKSREKGGFEGNGHNFLDQFVKSQEKVAQPKTAPTPEGFMDIMKNLF